MISMVRKTFLVLSFACIAVYAFLILHTLMTNNIEYLFLYGSLSGLVGGLCLVLSKAEKFYPLAYLFLLMAIATPIYVLAPRA